MPPLLSARTCWRAGWASMVLGVVLTIGADQLLNAVLSGGQDFDSPGVGLLSAVSTLAQVIIPASIALLVGSVVLRQVEHLAAALVASGTVGAADVEVPVPTVGRLSSARTADGDVDLDDVDGVVEHEPGVR